MILRNLADRRCAVPTKCALLAVALTCAGSLGASDQPVVTTDMESGFLPYVELAPMEVRSESMSVSIYARSKSDRRYAERFAESVIEIAYETMGHSTGHGLVIVGDEGDPHPLFVFKKFLELAAEDRIESGLTDSAKELGDMLAQWEAKVQFDGDSEEMPIDFDMVVPALPVPLEGVASKLYQVAWTEKFDETRVEHRLESLSAADLQDDKLAKYDWVFYLPPRGAFSEVMKELVPLVLKEQEVGFFQRMAIRSALTMFKPMIKGAVEGMRQGMMFFTVLRAESDFPEEEVEALTTAYMEALMPGKAPFSGGKRAHALAAIEAQKIENEEYAKDPFVSPEPLKEFDLASFSIFEGEYSDNGKGTTHRFSVNDENVTWQYLDREPGVFLPAGENLFVSADGKMTIEFRVDEEGTVTEVEERWVRRRKTVPRKS